MSLKKRVLQSANYRGGGEFSQGHIKLKSLTAFGGSRKFRSVKKRAFKLTGLNETLPQVFTKLIVKLLNGVRNLSGNWLTQSSSPLPLNKLPSLKKKGVPYESANVVERASEFTSER
jgi:hypothetical protein